MPASRTSRSSAPNRQRPIAEKKPVHQPPARRQGGQGVAQMQQRFGNRGTQALLEGAEREKLKLVNNENDMKLQTSGQKLGAITKQAVDRSGNKGNKTPPDQANSPTKGQPGKGKKGNKVRRVKQNKGATSGENKSFGKAPDNTKPKVTNNASVGKLILAGNLLPLELKKSLGTVVGGISDTAKSFRTSLAANPPQVKRPDGSPKNLFAVKDEHVTAESSSLKKIEKAPSGRDTPVQDAAVSTTPIPEVLNVQQLKEPSLGASGNEELTENDVSRLSESLDEMPVTDAALEMRNDSVPEVELTGNASPEQIGIQNNKLTASAASLQQAGARGIAQEMGENTRIFPSFPPETLTAKALKGGSSSAGKRVQTGERGGIENGEVISLLANSEKGGDIQAAVSKAQSDIADKQQDYANKVELEKAESDQKIAELEAQSSKAQSAAREEAKSKVLGQKKQWSTEQKATIAQADKEANAEVVKGQKDVHQRKSAAEKQAGQEIKKGNAEAQKEQRKAEQQAAEAKKQKPKKKSGFFGWVASKAKAAFNKIKSAISKVFELAKAAIKKAIEVAKKAALWAIEQGRKAVIAAIEAVGKALIVIGDRLLAAFPGLRDKFRKFIKNKVDQAVNKVNALAEQLKKAVTAALDALAAGLDKLVGWLEEGLLAVVDVVANVVDGAIKFAEKAIKLMGAFAGLVADIAPAPGRWIKNLGSSIVDGIRNHLWKALKEAVQQWFTSKLEQVLQLGSMVWGLIKSGALSLTKVFEMAWEGLKGMIPTVLITILVEKLVSMIVPATGAVMLIIEGLQAAWGALGRIVAAFKSFVTFLKAVKAGGAGVKFAKLLALSAVAVIDFVANWLIAKLAKGATKVAGKIKGMAKSRFGRRKNKSKSGANRGKKQAQKPVGKPIKPKRGDEDKKNRKKRRRLAKAERELPSKIDALLLKGTKGAILKARLLVWRARYRLSALYIKELGKSFRIIARVNPTATLGHGVRMDRDELLRFVREVAEEILKRKDVQMQADKILETQRAKKTVSGAQIQTVTIPKGSSIPAQVAADRRLPPLSKGKHREFTYEGEAVRARQAQSTRHEGQEHQLIREVDSSGKLLKAKKYIELAKSVGISGSDLVLAMRKFQRTGVASKGVDSSILAGLHKLMFSQEVLRSSAALLQAQMSLDLLAKGLSPQDVLGRVAKKGGLFPMSAEKAQGRAKAVDAFLAGGAESEKGSRVSQKERERQMRREVKLIRTWIKAIDIKFKAGSSQKDKIDRIKFEIKSRMLKSFGLL